jgi:hypothetical protein
MGEKWELWTWSPFLVNFRRDPVSLCQGIAKVERRMREDDGFIEKLMSLEKNLVEGRKRKIKK